MNAGMMLGHRPSAFEARRERRHAGFFLSGLPGLTSHHTESSFKRRSAVSLT